MRATILILCFFSLLVIHSFAQGVKISANPGEPVGSAILEVQSTTQGLLPPRMTTGQRDAIVDPEPGLMIFNTDISCMEYYRGEFAGWYSSCPMPPTVSTGIASLITGVSAEVSGSIASDGGATVTARGICWNTSPLPTLNDSFTTDGIGVGSFSGNLSGLSLSTTYFVRAYATNNTGTSYGNEISFTTLGLPVVSTEAVTTVSGHNASSGGNVAADGGAAVTSRGICWSTSPNPVLPGTSTSNGSGTGSFSSLMTDLSISTTFYVRAYATNSVGTSYGNEVSFTTTSGSIVSITSVGSSSWSVPVGVGSAEVLVVAGGGGGGSTHGGGGSGGQVVYDASYDLNPGGSVSYSVGAGGAGGPGGSGHTDNGSNGGNSSFGTMSAEGGGYGGAGYTGAQTGGPAAYGGGAGGNITNGSVITAPNGNVAYKGGNSYGGDIYIARAGGGGGAGGSGINASASNVGNGGPGVSHSITGVAVYYGGGGGGGSVEAGTSVGGVGGGGNGAANFAGSPGSANSGGGGGGGGGNWGAGAQGGSGVIIIRY